MGKMMHIGTEVDETMMTAIGHLARDMDRSPEALVHLALEKFLEEDAEMTAFIQAGIESAENEPLIDHAEVVAWVAERRRARSVP